MWRRRPRFHEKLHRSWKLRGDIPALPADVLDLAHFVATYYQEPMVRPRANAAPARLGVTAKASRARRNCEWATGSERRPSASGAPLNDDQQQAAASINDAAGSFAPCLLQGVTGSGKTEVYLAAAAECMAAGGQVLILVPEINLTPQFRQRISDALPNHRTVTLHSRLPAGERLRNWCSDATRNADLVLRTRLARLHALPRLSSSSSTKKHDPSFKQQEGVRYHGRDVAIWRRGTQRPRRARERDAIARILGPCAAGSLSWLKLPRRAVAAARLHDFRSRKPGRFGRRGYRGTVDGGACGTARSRGAIPRLHQPARIALSLAFRPRLAGRVPALQRRLIVHRETPICAVTIADTPNRSRGPAPNAGNVDLVPSGTARSASSAQLAGRFAQREHRAHRPRQHKAQATSKGFATACTRGTSTFSSARRCSQGTRLSATDAGRRARRRQRPIQR